MKHFILFFAFLLIISSCKKENPKISPNDVLVYSSQWACDNTPARLNQYNSIKLPYVFKEIWLSEWENPTPNYYEMWDKAHSIGVHYIKFPLVDVKGKILINPSVEEILKYL